MARRPLNRAGARLGAAATRLGLMAGTLLVALLGAWLMSGCAPGRPWPWP